MTSVGVTDIVFLGGTAVVSQVIEDELATLYGEENIFRAAGASRFETAVEVASLGVVRAGLSWDGLALATGLDYPDALAGGVLQGKAGSPMLLTAKNTLPFAVTDILEQNRTWISRVVFLGGSNAVSASVRDEVLAIVE
jgi:putative cell wall-binding protein